MTLIGLIIVLMLVGVLLWAINTYVPMAAPIKTLMNIVVVIVLVLWVVEALGLLGPLNVPLRVR